MAKSNLAAAPAAQRKRREGPRTPSRVRGVMRYNALLDATDSLLQTEDPDTVGLYQIAERAGVPPASVYHFFPTKEAAYLALVERHLDLLVEVHRQPINAELLQSWQDLEMIGYRRAMDFFNSHPPALKILYGGHGSVETRNIDKLFVRKLASTHYQRLDLLFHMPFIQDPEKKYEITLGIFDAIFEVSVRRNGCITEEYLQETYNACVAYQRLFLPERVERRQVLIEAAERGETISVSAIAAEAQKPS